MAPELLEPPDESEQFQLSFASDVYALSITLWEVSAISDLRGSAEMYELSLPAIYHTDAISGRSSRLQCHPQGAQRGPPRQTFRV
jgi:hypothetical protein